MTTSATPVNKSILVAVDDSENAERAVQYVARLLGGLPGFRITLVSIVSAPPEEYFATAEERLTWLKDEQDRAARTLDRSRSILTTAGFDEKDIVTQSVVKVCPSVGECILDVQRELGCGTVVVGRRGISKKEEFIFGSTSSKILHAARNCTVWAIA
jgi:nucleotide-binding universal stress UspA family protein